jgi:hypothetical protein
MIGMRVFLNSPSSPKNKSIGTKTKTEMVFGASLCISIAIGYLRVDGDRHIGKEHEKTIAC